ncbi:MAG: transposase [Phycisphaerales bacterium]|nr:MAG: transposase [Phycisphaerales bacterium]
MPRPIRTCIAGGCYHVLNRGNAGSKVFHKDADYQAFVDLLNNACARLPLSILSYCLMPNHFHLVLQPKGQDDLSRWMQWLMTSHVRRYHRHHGTFGHVWQGRFKSFPIQADEHLYTVLRYVERNPLRAGLVRAAQDWPWSSLRWWRRNDRPKWLSDGPFDRPADWVRRVNRPQTAAELEALRRSIERGTPFGSQSWQSRTAARLGLQSSLRPRGRPRGSR